MEKKDTTITRLAKEKGVSTSEMFEIFIQNGLIKLGTGSKKWELTDKGKLLGGRYIENPNFRDYMEWPKDIELNNFQNSAGDVPIPIKKHDTTKEKSANTEGEIYIKEFFREVGINYEYQQPIRHLANDIKTLRVADFYLPKYQVYVEFLGHWNTNAEYRDAYSVKKKIYQENRIPCVYLYPENLGFIHFAFDHRIIKTLKDNHRESELKKYKLWKLLKGTMGNLLSILGISVVLAILLFYNEFGKLFMVLLILYNVFIVIKIWYLIYVKDSYNLNRMLHDSLK